MPLAASIFRLKGPGVEVGAKVLFGVIVAVLVAVAVGVLVAELVGVSVMVRLLVGVPFSMEGWVGLWEAEKTIFGICMKIKIKKNKHFILPALQNL